MRSRLLVLFTILILLGSVGGATLGQRSTMTASQSFDSLGLTSLFGFQASPQSTNPIQTTSLTGPPLQRAIKNTIDLLNATGKPHPLATFNHNVSSYPDSFGLRLLVRGTTVLDFSGPAEANKTRWDNLNVTRPSSGNGTVLEGDFTQNVTARYPNIYGPGPCPNNACATYGLEARRYTITENFTMPVSPTQSIPILASHQSTTVRNVPTMTAENVLMGFSVGQHIDWTVHDEIRGCLYGLCVPIFSYLAGYLLDYGIGLRLPAKVEVDSPDPMIEGGGYTHTTSLNPADFLTDDYKAMKIPDDQLFDGHEFEARFHAFLGIEAEVVGVGDVIPEWNIKENIDLGKACSEQLKTDCQDFVTPFGVDPNGQPIQFPFNGATITLDPDLTRLKVEFGGAGLGVGLGTSFSLGPATRITADWSATGSATGLGTVNYTSPRPSEYTFEPTRADNSGTGSSDNSITITLENFKYYFSTLTIGFCADLRFTGWLSLLLDTLVGTSRTPCFDIFAFTLDISDQSLPQHAGTLNPTVTEPVPPPPPPNYALYVAVAVAVILLIVLLMRRRKSP